MSEALGTSAELREGFTAEYQFVAVSGKQGRSPERQEGQWNGMSWGVLGRERDKPLPLYLARGYMFLRGAEISFFPSTVKITKVGLQLLSDGLTRTRKSHK